jgi:hypothetical protein
MLEAYKRPLQFLCDLRPWKEDPIEDPLAASASGTIVAPEPPESLVPPPPTTVSDFQKTAAVRGPTLLRAGSTPKKDYEWNFQVAQECAKRGDENGVLDALTKMRYFQEAAHIKPDDQAKNELGLYASLYAATLQSAKDTIEGYESDGGRGRNIKRALDPFIEKYFDREDLFSKLKLYASKAGISSVEVAQGKKEIDGSLYDYYRAQAMSYGEKAKSGGDFKADIVKFISKLREAGPGAGLSRDKIEQDVKNICRNACDWRNRPIKKDEKVVFQITYVTEQEEMGKIGKEESQFRSDAGNFSDSNTTNLFKPDTFQNLDYVRLDGGTITLDYKDPRYDTYHKPIRVVIGKEGGYITAYHRLNYTGEVYYYFPPSDKERVVLIDHGGKIYAPRLMNGEYRPDLPQNYDFAAINETASFTPEGFPSNKVPQSFDMIREREVILIQQKSENKSKEN